MNLSFYGKSLLSNRLGPGPNGTLRKGRSSLYPQRRLGVLSRKVSTMFRLSRLLELASTIPWRLNGTTGRHWLGRRRQPFRRATPGLEDLEGRIVPTLLGQQLFPADYPWNQKISNAPVAANSAAVIANIGSSIHIHPDWGDDNPANGSSPLYGIPFNVVHGNSVAKVNVIVDNYPSESDLLPVPIPANAVIEGDYQNAPNH